MGNDSRPHYIAFKKKYGDGPYRCHGCKQIIEGVVVRHHLDGDHGNNDLSNIVPMHHGCHTKEHMKDQKAMEERNLQIKSSVKSSWDAMTPEQKSARSAAMKKAHQNCDCPNHVKGRALATRRRVG